MPELPEVATIENQLGPWVVGQSFTQVTILDSELVCVLFLQGERGR